jgi:hypothetical protein
MDGFSVDVVLGRTVHLRRLVTGALSFECIGQQDCELSFCNQAALCVSHQATVDRSQQSVARQAHSPPATGQVGISLLAGGPGLRSKPDWFEDGGSCNRIHSSKSRSTTTLFSCRGLVLVECSALPPQPSRQATRASDDSWATTRVPRHSLLSSHCWVSSPRRVPSDQQVAPIHCTDGQASSGTQQWHPIHGTTEQAISDSHCWASQQWHATGPHTVYTVSGCSLAEKAR